MTAPLPDAGQNWVDRHAPEGLKPWLKLGRFDRPVGIWLLLLPGWQGIALAVGSLEPDAPPLILAWLVVAFAVGACLMRAAGCAFNDIVDRDIDAKVARTAARPVASGQISVKGAWAFVIGCCLISFLILLTLGLPAVLLGVASLALVAAYPFMKRITWWPQAWLGLTFNWGALMGFAAAASAAPFILCAVGEAMVASGQWTTYGVAAGSGEALTATALLLYLGGVFWTLGYDTIYALQDIEDDALAGVKSSARRLGGKVRDGVAFFYLIAAILAAGAALVGGLSPLFWIGWLAWGAHLAWQVRKVRADDPQGALRLFKSNRDAGVLLLIALGLGAVPIGG
ncbi:UbiA family prenyltransferase [Brevundimonas sp. A19_0]|uniref:UbiA family prenyltransferase n=1 Tax=Brevundimonas sp. A19_0 TaxID=2821087 RepID=UPI001ADA8E48|nr:UbiA family prenyltransferase [Brevundimonas sp. A19_0]MBO9500985.1 4-hydroxybenzoate octaprenyltransferase [Brevundimonas sp. A19_0]